MIFRYKIADIVFDADIRYKYTYNIMKDYLVDDEPARFSIVITDEDISTIRVCFDVDVDSLVIRPQRYEIKYQIIDKNTVELYPVYRRRHGYCL